MRVGEIGRGERPDRHPETDQGRVDLVRKGALEEKAVRHALITVEHPRADEPVAGPHHDGELSKVFDQVDARRHRRAPGCFAANDLDELRRRAPG